MVPTLAMTPSYTGNSFQQEVSLFCHSASIVLSLLSYSLDQKLPNSTEVVIILATLKCNYEGILLSSNIHQVQSIG